MAENNRTERVQELSNLYAQFSMATVEDKKRILIDQWTEISQILNGTMGNASQNGMAFIRDRANFEAKHLDPKYYSDGKVPPETFKIYKEQLDRLVSNISEEKINLMSEDELDLLGSELIIQIYQRAEVIKDFYEKNIDKVNIFDLEQINRTFGNFPIGEHVLTVELLCRSKEKVTESTETTSERVEETVSEVTDDTIVTEDSATVGITPEAETSTGPRKTWGDRARQFFDRFKRTNPESTVESGSAKAEVIHDESDMGFAEVDVEEVKVEDYVEPTVEKTVTETEQISEEVSGENIPTISRELNKAQAKIVQTAIRYSAGHVRDTSIQMGGKAFFNSDREYTRFAETVSQKIDNFATLGAIDYIKRTPSLDSRLSGTIDKVTGILGNLPTGTMNREQLNAVNDYMSKFAHLLQSIASADHDGKLNLSSPVGIAVFNNYVSAVEIYSKSIEAFSQSYAKIDNIRESGKLYGSEGYSRSVYNLGLTAIQEEDLALVEAFKFIGSPLVRNEATGKWSLDRVASENSPNGIEFIDADGKASKYHLPEENVQAFIDGYLNKSPLERGNKVITPQGLFRFYVDSLGNSPKHANKYEKSVVDKFVNDAKLQFDAGSRAWQTTIVTNETMIKRDAIRMALADVYYGILSNQEMIDSVYDSDLISEIDDNTLLNAASLDRLSDSIIDGKDEIDSKIESDRTEIGAVVESITEKYREAYDKARAEYNTAKANNDHDLSVYETRMNNVAQSMATLIATREIQATVIGKAIEGIDSSNDQVVAVEEIAGIFATNDCIEVSPKDNGEWSIIFNDSKLPIEVSSKFGLAERAELGKKINKLINLALGNEAQATHTAEGEEPKTFGDHGDEQVEEEFIELDDKLSTEDLYNLFFDSMLGSEPILSQVLEDEAIYDRTESIFSPHSPDNPFKEAYQRYFNQAQNPTTQGFIESLNGRMPDGESFGNFLFTENSISRLRDPGLQKTKKDEYIKYLVLMDRLGKTINSNQHYLDAINGMPSSVVNGPDTVTPEVKQLLEKLYAQELENIEKNPPNEQEIERAQQKFATLNLKKSFERLRNFEGKDKITESIKDPDVLRILTDRESNITELYNKEKEAEEQARREGRDLDQEVEDSKKEDPYKFGDKYNKKDGSAILKKLKPYCAKSSIKIIDDIIKMIDNTMIYPDNAKKATDAVATADRDDEEIVVDGDAGANSEKPSREKVEVGEKTPSTSDEKVDEGGSTIDPELKKLQDELENKGQFAYLTGGSIIDEWLNAYDVTDSGSIENNKFIEGLGNLYKFIGNPDMSSAENLQTRLGIVKFLETIMCTGEKNPNELASQVESIKAGLENDPNLSKEVVESILSTLDQSNAPFFVMALEFTSKLDRNSGKIEIGSQLSAQIIDAIKTQEKPLEQVLFDAHFYTDPYMHQVTDLYYMIEKERSKSKPAEKVDIDNIEETVVEDLVLPQYGTEYYEYEEQLENDQKKKVETVAEVEEEITEEVVEEVVEEEIVEEANNSKAEDTVVFEDQRDQLLYDRIKEILEKDDNENVVGNAQICMQNILEWKKEGFLSTEEKFYSVINETLNHLKNGAGPNIILREMNQDISDEMNKEYSEKSKVEKQKKKESAEATAAEVTTPSIEPLAKDTWEKTIYTLLKTGYDNNKKNYNEHQVERETRDLLDRIQQYQSQSGLSDQDIGVVLAQIQRDFGSYGVNSPNYFGQLLSQNLPLLEQEDGMEK